MKKTVTRTLDTVAALVLLGAMGIVVVVLFSLLTIALGWLVIPVLAIGGAVAWAFHRGWIGD